MRAPRNRTGPLERERLDVNIVNLAKRRQRILDIEMRRAGAGIVVPRADEYDRSDASGARLIKLALV